jgi:hypothetical protein
LFQFVTAGIWLANKAVASRRTLPQSRDFENSIATFYTTAAFGIPLPLFAGQHGPRDAGEEIASVLDVHAARQEIPDNAIWVADTNLDMIERTQPRIIIERTSERETISGRLA